MASSRPALHPAHILPCQRATSSGPMVHLGDSRLSISPSQSTHSCQVGIPNPTHLPLFTTNQPGAPPPNHGRGLGQPDSMDGWKLFKRLPGQLWCALFPFSCGMFSYSAYTLTRAFFWVVHCWSTAHCQPLTLCSLSTLALITLEKPTPRTSQDLFFCCIPLSFQDPML